jgi:hypothetical protein
VGVSDSASNKHFLEKDYRNWLADLETNYHLDDHAPLLRQHSLLI